MRIVLVHSGNDDGIDRSLHTQSWAPLGIISLSTALVDAFGHVLNYVTW